MLGKRTGRYEKKVHTYESRSIEDLAEKGYSIGNINSGRIKRIGAFKYGLMKYATCTKHDSSDLLPVWMFGSAKTNYSKIYSICLECVQKSNTAVAGERGVCKDDETESKTPPIPLCVFISRIGEMFSICYTLINFEKIVFKSDSFVNQFNTYPTASRMLTKQVFEEIKMIEGLE